MKNFQDAKGAIEDTDGGRLWRSLDDLQGTVLIFEASTTELLDEICLFGDRSKNLSFWHEAIHSEAELHTRAVKRKLFNCTSALMALVDHARNFQGLTPVTGYADRLKIAFPAAGLHEFLQCLRNYNTHWRIAQANWVIRHDSKPAARAAQFIVTKAELLRWDGWNAKAKGYIASAPDDVDIYDVFYQYREHVQAFYAWHRGAVFDEYAPVLRSFLEYKRLYEGLLKKYEWNVVISHLPAMLNPYQYLERYLPRQQFERLLAYEHRSEAQVDALIQMLGMEDFCDAQLRQKVLSLFQRAQ